MIFKTKKKLKEREPKEHLARKYADEYAMEKQCKSVEVELPITNNDARENSNLGYWQIVGYEEIKDSKVEE